VPIWGHQLALNSYGGGIGPDVSILKLVGLGAFLTALPTAWNAQAAEEKVTAFQKTAEGNEALSSELLMVRAALPQWLSLWVAGSGGTKRPSA
jgi:hypothetical protein